MSRGEPVSPAMRAEVEAELARIAREEGVTILMAVESGSRAWGFHSPDSDHDVRFVYARPLDWHLRVRPGRDVIERPLSAELDVSGWELRKALALMLRGNAVIGEWLRSPIVYAEAPRAVAALRGLAGRALTLRPSVWHHVAHLHRQERRVTGEEGVRVKRLFYMLRPALALRWMRLHGRAFPPMNIRELMAGCALDARQTAALDRLIALKRDLPEGGAIARADPVLMALVAAEKAAAEAFVAGAPPRRAGPGLAAEADRLHRELTLASDPAAGGRQAP